MGAVSAGRVERVDVFGYDLTYVYDDYVMSSERVINRLRLMIEDAWGGDIVSATTAHLAGGTPAEALFAVSFMNDWTNEHVAGYQPRSSGGVGRVPDGPGVAIEVDASLLGEPIWSAAA